MSNQLRIAYARLQACPGPLAPLSADGAEVVLIDGGPTAPPDQQKLAAAIDQVAVALGPTLFLSPELHVNVSLGGGDPSIAARVAAQRFAQSGNQSVTIAVIQGHDLLDSLETLLREEGDLPHLETGARFTTLRRPPVAASVVLTAEPIISAFKQGARVVFIGRTSASAMVAAAAEASGIFPTGIPDHWVAQAEQLLQSGASTISLGSDEVVGDGDASARKVVESPRPKLLPEGRLPVEILYRKGYGGYSLLTLSGPNTTQRLDELVNRLDEDHPGEFQSGVYAKQGDSEESLALVRFQADTFQKAESAARRMEQLVAHHSSGSEELSSLPFQVFPEYGNWPTSVPVEAIEWSVDVRAAAEWLD